jgi:methanogenic corrinoid protein MtbC1
MSPIAALNGHQVKVVKVVEGKLHEMGWCIMSDVLDMGGFDVRRLLSP